MPKEMILIPDFHPFPELQTERLLLRRIELSDAPALYKLRADDHVIKYLDRAKPDSIDEIYSLIKTIQEETNRNNSVNWAITIKGDTRLIGTIGFWRMQKEHFRAELGYMLFPEFEGKGLMREALTIVLGYGFKKMNLHSVEANCNPNNNRSIKLLEKNNFIREGLFKENYYYKGKFLDSAIYSLLSWKFSDQNK